MATPLGSVGPFQAGQSVKASWLQAMLTSIRQSLNVKASFPLKATVTPAGIQLSMAVDVALRVGRVVALDGTKKCLTVLRTFPSFPSGIATYYASSDWTTDPVPTSPAPSGTTPFVDVYVDGCPYEYADLFFSPGKRIKYWSDAGSGRYITLLEDDSFWAYVSPAGGSLVSKFPYSFTAMKYNTGFTIPLTESAANPFTASDTEFTGTCYNLNEMDNIAPSDTGVTGNGLSIAEDGTMNDTSCIMQPIGPHYNRIYRFWDSDKDAYSYFFLPQTNSAA